MVIIDPDFAEIDEPIVTLRMTKTQAESLTFSISDFLCWAAGFNAALGADDHDRRPMGVGHIRELNIALKSAIDRAEKQ